MLNTSTTPTVPTGYPKEITKTIVFKVETPDDEAFVNEEDFKSELLLFLADVGCAFVSIS
jgi:hypothetical protein